MLTATQRARIKRRITHLRGRLELRGLPDRSGHDRAELSALLSALAEIDAWRASYPDTRPRAPRADALAQARAALPGGQR